ncbi:MAG: M20/M25/M40 family metallo-hydrolase [Alphaproteobacteria bacterium]
MMDKIYAYIDANRDRFIEELKGFLRIPSVATNRDAVATCSAKLDRALKEVGFESRIMPSSGNPMVYGERKGSGATLLLYGHYDVMPADDAHNWASPPFEPTERDGRLFARGVGDNKAQHYAHIKAVEALRACGVPSASLKFVLEGEEETGSTSLPGFVAEHKALLDADVCYAADGPRHESNRPTIYLGCRGVMGFELSVRTASRDVHSGNRGNVVPNPAWRLLQALSTMRDASGRVLIDGFYDDVRPISPDDRRMVDALPYDGAKMAKELAVEELRGLPAAEYHERVMYRPTLNISGLVSGYGGEGIVNIVPATATAKMDIRLVVDQQPDRIASLVRRHLDRHGFTDITLAVHDSMKPSRTPSSSNFIAPIVEAAREASGEDPVVLPALGGSIPQYAFVDALGIPCIWSAYANWDEQNHAPNENMVLDLFIQSIKISANVFHSLGRS